MVVKTILNDNQVNLLNILAGNEEICRHFYLTGGTALAEFYLHHRYSEDLDFFSENEVDAQGIFVLLKSISKATKIKKVDMEQSFNRNLFFLHLQGGDVIKTEFTYFAFPRIEEKKKFKDLQVDSLLDIAVNKIFTIYQNPRARDFIDLYLIVKEKKWKIADLIKKAKIKFDWHVDALQMGAQFLRVKEVKDFPLLIIPIEPEEWQDFFMREARILGKQAVG